MAEAKAGNDLSHDGYLIVFNNLICHKALFSFLPTKYLLVFQLVPIYADEAPNMSIFFKKIKKCTAALVISANCDKLDEV